MKLRTITVEELEVILDNHRKWLILKDAQKNKDSDEKLRADLNHVIISNHDFGKVDLRYAILTGAELRYCCFNGSDFSGADMRFAVLDYSELSDSDFTNADLYASSLHACTLIKCNFTGASLEQCDMSTANLKDANFKNANVIETRLMSADLNRAKNLPHLPQLIVCPPVGSFTAYKKLADGFIAELFIPKSAKRSNATSRKCRCDKAKVVAIWNKRGEKVDWQRSNFNYAFIYTVGHYVSVDDFNENRWEECTRGIHFFMSKKEAKDY